MKQAEQVRDMAIAALEDLKAVELVVLDVRGKSIVTDFMIVVSGTSSRHVKAMAANVSIEAKKNDLVPLGVEGDSTGEWVLVDLGDVVVHVMLPETRAFYQLEKLWEAGSIEELSEAKPKSSEA